MRCALRHVHGSHDRPWNWRAHRRDACALWCVVCVQAVWCCRAVCLHVPGHCSQQWRFTGQVRMLPATLLCGCSGPFAICPSTLYRFTLKLQTLHSITRQVCVSAATMRNVHLQAGAASRRLDWGVHHTGRGSIDNAHGRCRHLGHVLPTVCPLEQVAGRPRAGPKPPASVRTGKASTYLQCLSGFEKV